MTGQMDIYECIEVATTGSDGKPTTEERSTVEIGIKDAARIANSIVDDVVDALEHELGIELTDEQWETVSQGIEDDFAEAIRENFAEL